MGMGRALTVAAGGCGCEGNDAGAGVLVKRCLACSSSFARRSKETQSSLEAPRFSSAMSQRGKSQQFACGSTCTDRPLSA